LPSTSATDTAARPCGTIIPNSARWPRSALISMVRRRIRSSRVRCSTRRPLLFVAPELHEAGIGQVEPVAIKLIYVVTWAVPAAPKGAMSESLRRQISSPVALFVFEATARCGSFRAAAVELNVTQPSISYQIKNLERHLGTRLFERRGRNISLTDDGETLFRSVERGFANIQTGLAEILHRTNANLLTFCLSSSAAAHFLLPRYARLRSSLPRIELNLKIMSRDFNPVAEDGDFAILLGHGEWEELESWHLFDEVYFPLCAPNYFKVGRKVTLDTIKASNLLYLKEQFRKRDDWNVFFEAIGSPNTTTHDRITFSDQQAVLASAIEGQGVALGWLGMTDHLLDTGSLIKPVEIEVRTGRAFYLGSPKGTGRTRLATEFRDWIIGEGKSIQSRWEKTAAQARPKSSLHSHDVSLGVR
jgi:LysR family glycine cleavage system transcriptional activator